jgi:hypothetical protein
MNRIDRQLKAVGQGPRETVIAEYEAGLRQELQRLYSKAANGTATEDDLSRCDEIAHELREQDLCHEE